MHRFSFLLPTRGRPGPLRRLLESILETAQHPEEIEVVLCVDEDDPDSHNVTIDGLAVKTIIVPPGATMGMLNRTAFEASSGRFVMLINDDVVARTKNWDREIFRAYESLGDDVGLVHTNDLLFREKLCTFPILSRIACLETGVCPPEYQRYRIDDHISDIYTILGHVLGHRRILYLSGVVFEHLNYDNQEQGEASHVFESEDGKVYRPNQEIIGIDASFFDQKLEQRKADAATLAMLIDRLALEKKRGVYRRRLDTVRGPLAHRRGEVARAFPVSSTPKLLENATVTVAVVTSGLERPHARECLSRIKEHTPRVDLIILDNNGSANFNHPREMNRVLETAGTDYAVLLDDDVLVEQGWLEGLLQALDGETGLVGPLHKDRSGEISHSGVYLAGDAWGTHAHLHDVPNAPRVAQCLCSACILVDLKKCGHVRFNEAYDKYFLDLDYSLKIWEAGYKVVCSPYATVTHLAGATMPHGSKASLDFWEKDITTFRDDWIASGRLERLQRKFLSRYPFLLLLYGLPRRILSTLSDDTWEVSEFQRDVDRLVENSKPFPLFQSLLVSELGRCAARCRERGDRLKEECCQRVLKQLEGVSVFVGGPAPILLESYRKYNLVRYCGEILAVPQALGPLDLRIRANREKTGILVAQTLEQARRDVDMAMGSAAPDAPPLPMVVLLESYRGYNLAAFDGEVYAVPVSLGPLSLLLEANRHRPEVLREGSIEAARTRVDLALSVEMAAPALRSIEPPVLVVEDYKGFNVVRWGGRFLALPQGEGEFDPVQVERGRYSRTFSGDALSEVTAQIDRLGISFIRRAARRVRRRISGSFLW